jgi:hypothetical protein
MEVHFVINNKIVNITPYEINSLPLMGSEFIWVDFTNSLFEPKYQREISDHLWEIKKIRYVGKSDQSLESIALIVLEKIDLIDNIINYGI